MPSATRRFVITRLDGDVETNLAIMPTLTVGFTTDASQRPQAMEQARALRDANPGWVILLYSPASAGGHTDADRCWDSRINT